MIDQAENDDLRSLNAQIEFLLRRALRDADRMPARLADESKAGDSTREE